MRGKLVVNIYEDEEQVTHVNTEADIGTLEQVDKMLMLQSVCEALQLSPFDVMVFAIGFSEGLFTPNGSQDCVISGDLLDKLEEMGYDRYDES